MDDGIDRYGDEGALRLAEAAVAGDEVAVIRLVESGILVDARDAAGFTALMRAAYAGQVATARVLLDRGADPNARSLTDETPLMGAALGRSLEVTRLLLDRGADVNAVDAAGVTALQAILQQKPGDEDPDAVVEYCEVVDLLQSAHTGVCI
jgi:ankyrin repeat protein